MHYVQATTFAHQNDPRTSLHSWIASFEGRPTFSVGPTCFCGFELFVQYQSLLQMHAHMGFSSPWRYPNFNNSIHSHGINKEPACSHLPRVQILLTKQLVGKGHPWALRLINVLAYWLTGRSEPPCVSLGSMLLICYKTLEQQARRKHHQNSSSTNNNKYNSNSDTTTTNNTTY